MSPSIHHTKGARTVPVRWYETTWSTALKAAGQAQPARSPGGRGKARRARGLGVGIPRLRLPRIPVTTRRGLSQPSRSSRHRR
jgi:hypothetical protein